MTTKTISAAVVSLTSDFLQHSDLPRLYGGVADETPSVLSAGCLTSCLK